MSKNTNSVRFEWAFAEEGAVWHDAELLRPWPAVGAVSILPSLHDEPLPALSFQTTPLLPALVLLLIGLWTTASVPVSSPEAPARLQRQIEATLQQEERVWQQNDIAQFRTLLDPLAQPEWRSDWSMAWGIQPNQRNTLGTRIVSLEVQDQLLLVQTLVTQPQIAWWRSTPYRELRFYRRSSAGWVRTAPIPTAWGQVRTVATPHLRFHFYEQDAPTILALSAQVEVAYLQLYQLLGHPPPTASLTLTFGVGPDYMREFRMSEEPLRFASPRLLKSPGGLTDGEYITHLVISHLADRALLEILARNDRLQVSRWRNMLWGATGRLRIELLGQRSPWQQEAEAFFRQTNPGQPPLHFTDIDDRYTGLMVPREGYLWEYMAAESLIAYVEQLYGWEGVIALFGGFSHTSYWSKLIPNVFDQSAADLEADWNQYLVETYRASQSAVNSNQ